MAHYGIELPCVALGGLGWPWVAFLFVILWLYLAFFSRSYIQIYLVSFKMLLMYGLFVDTIFLLRLQYTL